MPFYEYRAINEDQSCDFCVDVFEVTQSMSDNQLSECPECGSPIKKLISELGAVLMGGREANQYKDIKAAKYWRDKNGVRHRVTSSDGYTGSATVSQQTATPDQVKDRKKKDQKKGNKDRLKLQKDRANAWNREQLKKT